MKYILLISLLASPTFAATVGKSSGCPEVFEVIANEGETFITIRQNKVEKKIPSINNRAFSLRAKRPATFRTSSTKDSSLESLPTFEFTMPAMMDSTLPQLVVSYSGVQHKCKVYIHGTAIKK